MRTHESLPSQFAPSLLRAQAFLYCRPSPKASPHCFSTTRFDPTITHMERLDTHTIYGRFPPSSASFRVSLPAQSKNQTENDKKMNSMFFFFDMAQNVVIFSVSEFYILCAGEVCAPAILVL